MPGSTRRRRRGKQSEDSAHSVNPLLEVVAGFQLRLYLRRGHLGILLQVLRVLPLEVFLTVLGVGLASEVAVRGGLLILGLAEGEGLGDGPGAIGILLQVLRV